MLRQLLLDSARWEKLAVIEEGAQYSYGDLARKAGAVAHRLEDAPPGNVGIYLPNSGDYIAALFGVWMAGRTAFPLSVQLTAHEIAPLLAQGDVGLVISTQAQQEVLEKLGSVGKIYMEDVEPASTPPHRIPDIPPQEPIILLATSGTTGSAKIVQLTEANIEATVLGFIAYNDYARFDDVEIRYVLATPYSSVYGLLILPVCLYNAFPLIIPQGTFTLNTLYTVVETHRVTHYEGGPAIPLLMDQMLGKPMDYDLDSLRFVGFGGSKVPGEALLRLDKAFPKVEFCPGYGMTESAALIARPYKRVKLHKRDSIGTAIDQVTVRVEAEGIITDVPNTVGELVVQGPNVMLGYYRNEAETRKILQDGWLHTGDMGYVDEDGDIFICGRKKNVIMVRGFSVYAEEVEASLQGSGLVKDCRIYGETAPTGGEILCADIVLQKISVGIDELRSWCAEHLAGYKQPQRIRIVQRISKTATGKTARAAHEAD